jgi:hypothetical protein
MGLIGLSFISSEYLNKKISKVVSQFQSGQQVGSRTSELVNLKRKGSVDAASGYGEGIFKGVSGVGGLTYCP